MSIHISANKGEIAKIVLLPGDPLRAKYIADNFLSNVTLVSSTRNAFYFTGSYKNKPVSIGASGMGCPSIGIYSYELYTEYEADCIIRIGTCGSYTEDLDLYDIVNAERAFSESSYALHAFGYPENHMYHEGHAYSIINDTADKCNKKIHTGAIHSSDVFYRSIHGIAPIAEKNNCLVVEMEAFALFATAGYLKKSAATLLTVSDIIPSHKKISADDREKSLSPMIELALEAILKM